MRKILFGLSLVLCAGASFAASPVAFDFAGVPVVTVMQATYTNLLHRDYVISPEVLALDKRMSMKVKALPVDDVAGFVDALLQAQGISVQPRNGIYYLDLLPPPAAPGAGGIGGGSASNGAAGFVERESDEVKVVEPINRNVEFMVAVVNAAFGGPVARPAGSRVVLSAPKARMARLVRLVGELDVAPRGVEVAASFVEVTRTNASSSGLSLAATVLGVKFAAQVGTGQGAVLVHSGSFDMVLDALQADGRFKQVSNSRVVGDESERVSLTVGDETPTIQSTGVDNAGNRVQNIVYRTSGVILDVLPKVLGSGRLALAVDGQVSSFQATLTGVAGSPTLVKRQVKTSVTVGDGEVLIIGGLDDSKSTGSTSGLSFLPKSWASKGSSDTKTDLVLILSARVIKPDAEKGV